MSGKGWKCVYAAETKGTHVPGRLLLLPPPSAPWTRPCLLQPAPSAPARQRAGSPPPRPAGNHCRGVCGESVETVCKFRVRNSAVCFRTLFPHIVVNASIVLRIGVVLRWWEIQGHCGPHQKQYGSRRPGKNPWPPCYLATLLPGHLATEVRRPRPSLHQNHSLTSAVDDTSDEGGMGDVGCSGSASLAVPAPSAPSFSSHFSAAMVSPVWGAGHDNKPPAISTRRRGLVDVCRKIGE